MKLLRNVGHPSRWSTPAVVASVSFVLTVAFVVRNLVAAGGDPTVFLAIGEDSGAARDYAQSLLGTDIHLRPGLGHDGRFFFVQANDPLLLEPETHAQVLDRPLYRYQRMLFPLIAGLGGLLPSWGIVWSMLGLSVLTFALGTYVSALVARGMGGSPWWGLAFGLNIGVISELLVGGSGHLSLALALGSVAALQRGRPGLSVVVLTGAVLAREVLVIAVIGIAIWLWVHGYRRLAVVHLVVPTVAAGAWWLYLRTRWTASPAEIEEIGWPLQGIARSAEFWSSEPLSLVAGLAVVLMLVLFTLRFIRSKWLVGYLALGFVPLALLLTRQVWFDYFNITRAVSPVITAYILTAFAGRPGSDESKALEGHS